MAEEIILTKFRADFTERYRKCGVLLKSGKSKYNENFIEQLQIAYTFLSTPQPHQFIASQFRLWVDAGLYVASYVLLDKIYKTVISMGRNDISKFDNLDDLLTIVEQKKWVLEDNAD